MGVPSGPVVVASCAEQPITTGSTAFVSYTPPEAGNYLLLVYWRTDEGALVAGHTGTISMDLTYHDATGARSLASIPTFYSDDSPSYSNDTTWPTSWGTGNVVLSSQYMLNSVASQAIEFSAINASHSDVVYVSATLLKL
jgi:hypothetical protein